MSDITNLKLINAVDPTKIKVTINEKFSKLTLSSNKKKTDEQTKPIQPKEIEKRQSASRNLMEDLTSTDNDHSNIKYTNPILKSSSSSLSEHKSHPNLTNTFTQVDDRFDESKNLSASSMERLHLSENDNVLDDLTEKVSNLTVDRDRSKIKNEEVSYKINSFAENEIIEIDSDESDEESVIYVSDSEDENFPVAPPDEYNLMITSDIVESGKTGEPELPCTLSNECADRIEAFLRDVSQERRNIAAAGGGLADDSFLMHLPTPTDNVENVLKNSFKAKQMATADTESMKTNTDSVRQSTNSQHQKNIALNDTEAVSESDEVTIFSQNNKSAHDCVNEQILGSQELKARRLALDETEANTTIESENDNVHDSDQSQVQEESIVIPETSIEESTSDTSTTGRTSNPTVNNHEIVSSEDVLTNSVIQSNDDSDETSIELSMGKVNISAKINIKLQIRTNFSISTDESNSSNENNESQPHSSDNNDDDDGGDGNDGNISERNDCDENNIPNKAVSELIAKEKQIQLQQKNPELCTPKPKEGLNAMSHAEKLLAELYGQSWQTPEILRTLKFTKKVECNQSVRAKKSVDSQIIEQSQLVDDFSTFRINIEKTNLDSTRLVTPKPKSKKQAPKEVQTEQRKPTRKAFQTPFKAPQTEFKKKPPKPINERWRQLVDSDSEPEHNISDDDHVEQTILTDDESKNDDDNASNASDSSWQALTEDESNASDVDEDKARTKNTKTKSFAKIKNAEKKHSKDEIIYMDLSKNEVSIVQKSDSPPANHDENFRKRLSDILDSCRHEPRPQLEATPTTTTKSKRRLFTAQYDSDENGNGNDVENIVKEKNCNLDLHDDSESVRFNGVLIPKSFNIFNKRLESVKTGAPVYKITPPRSKQPIAAREEATPFKTPTIKSTQTPRNKQKVNELCSTPSFKYSFLKSLDVCVGKSMCHPDALVFRENYRQKKEDLAKILYELYNSKLFNNDLNVPIQWNKKLLNTAGRCLNKKKAGVRLSVVELSDKVLTSADRLRCTLIHELCHAATWIFNGEGGHGATWKEWARKANAVFPDLPKIGVCHQYDIEYKYTYKCTLCAAKSYYHSKSKKVENIRCSYCYGAIEIFLNKKDKEGNIMPTPVREPKGFAKFVKEKYQQYKRPDMKHAEVMKLLSNEYGALKITDKVK